MGKKRFRIQAGESEYFHHHAGPILAGLKYNNVSFKERLLQAICMEVNLDVTERSEKGKSRPGLKAQDVNEALRTQMQSVFGDDVLFEVKEREGFWEWGQKKEGFDFAIIDHLNNVINVWNACFGRRPVHDGDLLWESKINDSDLFRQIVEQRSDFLGGLERGKNAPIPHEERLPVLGEIQFGNHALRGVDMFRLMKAHRSSRIGLIVYVAATGKLESLLSSGIVTFNVMRDFLTDFEKEINVPVWLIGLDCCECEG